MPPAAKTRRNVPLAIGARASDPMMAAEAGRPVPMTAVPVDATMIRVTAVPITVMARVPAHIVAALVPEICIVAAEMSVPAPMRPAQSRRDEAVPMKCAEASMRAASSRHDVARKESDSDQASRSGDELVTGHTLPHVEASEHCRAGDHGLGRSARLYRR